MNFNRPGHIEPEKIEPAEVEVPPARRKRSRGKGLLWGLILVLLVGGVLANGARNHYAQGKEVDAIAEAREPIL